MNAKFFQMSGSIRKNFIKKTLLFVSVMLLVAAAVAVFIFTDQQRHAETQQELSEKVMATEAVSADLNQLFFYVRSYYSYRQPEDRSAIAPQIDTLRTSMEVYRGQDLEREELLFVNNLESFLIDYEERILPQSFELIEDDNYGGLRLLGGQGTTDTINALFAQSGELRDQALDELQAEYDLAMSESNRNIALAMGLCVLIFFALIFGSQRLVRKIVEPVEELTLASNQLAKGESVPVQAAERKDEIGVLGQAFLNMVNVMQQNEEELTAQNEELLAQQEMLEEALDENEKEKMKIDRYSQLNQTMSTKLDKDEFLTSIFSYVNELYPCDKSILYVIEQDEYRAEGLPEESIEQWRKADKSEWIHRLKEESHIMITRNASPSEWGIAETHTQAYDYYTSIKDANNNIFAIFTGVKIGTPYTEEEMEEIEAVMNHVGLGLERALVYEEIARSRKLSQDILDNVNEAIQFVSPEGASLQSNREMNLLIQQLNSNPEEQWMEGILRNAANPQALREFYHSFIKDGFEGTKSQQFEQITGDDRKVMIVYGTTVYDDMQKLGTVFVYRDMTREFELDQMKSELVSTVSHELRTPLSSVLGFTELLLTKELKPERQKRYLNTIHKEAKRLTNLINDFLDLQRMEAGSQPYEMKETALDSIAMDVIYQFKNEKNHQLSFVDESNKTIVEADEERIQQVLTNLVSNAVKFSPNGGEVTIHLRNEGDDVVVSIGDEGLGIPEKSIASLFNKFQRIDEGDRKNIGGTGLGLAICREIVERHGGKIWVDSVEGKGSTFSFRLPLKHVEISKQIPANAEEYPEGSSVVIVEDDSSLALLLSEELKSHGFKIIHHLNPDHAYRDIVRTIPSAVVVDLMLGETIDGWDLVQKLKENEDTKDIPIVISSALDRSDEKMRKYGIEQYLTKPYPPQDLSATLLYYIREHQENKGDIFFPSDENM